MKVVELDDSYCDVEYMESQILIYIIIIKFFRLRADTWVVLYPVTEAEIAAGGGNKVLFICESRQRKNKPV